MANGLPTLNTGGINIVPGLEAGARMKSMQQKNFLNQKKIANYDEDRERGIRIQEATLDVKGIDAATKSGGSPEQMGAVFERITGRKADFSISGEDVSIKLPSGTKMTGPRSVIAEAADAINKDPKHLENPATWKYLASKGVNFEAAPTAYKEGQIVTKKEGDKFMNYKVTNGKLVKESEAPRYKTETNINVDTKSTGGERENLAKGKASLDLLDNLQGLFEKDFTGLITGNVSKVKDIWGGNTLKQSEFNAATATLKNQVIKEITGAQMSEVEAKRIMKQVPDITDHPKVWQAKWNQTRKNLFNIQRRRLEVMERSGVRTPADPEETDTENDPLGIR